MPESPADVMNYRLISLILLVVFLSVYAAKSSSTQTVIASTSVSRPIHALSEESVPSLSIEDSLCFPLLPFRHTPPQVYRMPLVAPDSSVQYNIQVDKPDSRFTYSMSILVPEGTFLNLKTSWSDSLRIDTSLVVPQLNPLVA